MLYISGIHALNLPCSLDTCGDWHASALKWEDITYRNTTESIYGEYGIEKNCSQLERGLETPYVANYIRACLDLLVEGNYPAAQGMNEDYICNPKYDREVFEMVYKAKDMENWEGIQAFMGKEYKMKWLQFLEEKDGRKGKSKAQGSH